MTRDEAYNTLGLKSDCTKNQIKSAFRKKAKFVHPDVNDSKDAHESFIRLTEAFDILINNRADTTNTSSQTSKKQTQQTTDPFIKYAKVYKAPSDPAEYREWLIVAKARAKKVAQKEYEIMLEDIKLMKKAGSIIFKISIISLMLSLFCIYEVHFNGKTHSEKITNIQGSVLGYRVITDKNSYKIGAGDLINVAFLDDSVSVSKTSILGIYKHIRFHMSGKKFNYKYFDEYRYGIIAGMYIGLIISLVGIIYRKKSTGGVIAIFSLGLIFQLGSFLAILFGLTI